MALHKKKSSYWKFISFILILAFGGMVAYDIKLHGSFKESTVGRTLHDTGALAYGNLALEQAKVYTQKGAEWTRVNGPVYYATAVEVSKPYLELARDLGIIAYNSANKAWVGIDSWCTKNAPDVTSQVKKYAAVAGEATIQYAGDFVRYTKVGFKSAQDYAVNNIFVGNWSPENLQKMTHVAVNVTQQYVISTYEWIVEQVDAVNKEHSKGRR